jgi:hypothetical protein
MFSQHISIGWPKEIRGNDLLPYRCIEEFEIRSSSRSSMSGVHNPIDKSNMWFMDNAVWRLSDASCDLPRRADALPLAAEDVLNPRTAVEDFILVLGLCDVAVGWDTASQPDVTTNT